MNAQQALQMADGLAWLAEHLRTLPENKSDTLRAAAACTMARMIAIDLARGLNRGLDPYDALVDAASGSITMDRNHTGIFRLLADILDEEESPPLDGLDR